MSHNTKTDNLRHLHAIRVGDQPSCLFVGDPFGQQRADRLLPAGLRMESCQIYELVRHLRQAPMPDMVLSFAITPQFDCLDLAQLLRLNGFAGRQRIVDPNLPAPMMICREVRLACPGLDFAVLDLSELRLT